MVSKVPERIISIWEVVSQLCSWSPHLRAVRRELLDGKGSLNPHQFMGDVVTRVGACSPAFGNGAAKERGELEAILALLESGMKHGDRGARNVISAAFVEQAAAQPFYPDLYPLLGPHLRKPQATPVAAPPAGSAVSSPVAASSAS